jgi:hypothetical protein
MLQIKPEILGGVASICAKKDARRAVSFAGIGDIATIWTACENKTDLGDK